MRATGLTMAALLAAAPAVAETTLTNGRITAVLGGTTTELPFANNERMDSLSWIDSNGVSTANVVRSGGNFCGDPIEFFGQSYGVSEAFWMVIAGAQTSWKPGLNPALGGKAVGTGKNACATALVSSYGADMSGVTRTAYALSRTASRVNALRVSRTFTFNKVPALYQDGLRAYVPRLPWLTVLVPASSGAVQVYDAGCCAFGSPSIDWNGKWFAVDDGTGRGLAIIRDKSSTAAAYIWLDNDTISRSNNSAIALRKPAGGWTGTLTETEWLCFYDATTWPATVRAAGGLPKGCQVPAP